MTLPRGLHPTLAHWWCPALLASAGPMTWRTHPRRVVVAGDDVAPTSLNEGRGEVVLLAHGHVPPGPV